MRAGVLGEVDQFRGFSDSAQGCFGHRFRLAGQGDDAAVVVGVAFAIEQVHAGDLAHRGDDGVDLCGIAPFGEIRNAFDQSFHVVRRFFAWIMTPRFIVNAQRFTPK